MGRFCLPALLLAACQAPEPPTPTKTSAVTCVDAAGQIVRDAEITFHTCGTGGDTIVMARTATLGGGVRVRAADAASITVPMVRRLILRGRVQLPEGHDGPVRVCEMGSVRMLLGVKPVARSEPRSFLRLWSDAASMWSPPIEELGTMVAPDGTFALSALGDGPLLFAGPGLATTESRQSRDGILAAEARVAVTLLGADGVPVMGGLVHLMKVMHLGPGEPILGDEYVWTESTDMDGRAVVGRLPDGIYCLIAKAPGLVAHHEMLELETGARKDLRVRLDHGVTLTGTVRDSRGQPLPGATIKVDQLGVLAFHPLAEGTTDALGEYRMQVPRAKLQLWAYPAPVTLLDNTERDIDLTRGTEARHRLDIILERR